jgi:hypothetical protein
VRPSALIEWPLAAAGCAIAWAASGEVAQITSYFAAKAYFDTQIHGDYDPSSHLNAIAYSLQHGTRDGAVLGAIAYVIFYGISRDWLAWRGVPLAILVAIVVGSFGGYLSFGSFFWSGVFESMLASLVCLIGGTIFFVYRRKTTPLNKLCLLTALGLIGTVAVQFVGFSLTQQGQAQFALVFGETSPQTFCSKLAEMMVKEKTQKNPNSDADKIRHDVMNKCLSTHR